MRFCRESGECRDYALFLSFFYSEIYSEKSNFGRILAAGGSDPDFTHLASID